MGLQTYACKHIFKPVKLGLLLVYSYYQRALYNTTWLNPILYKQAIAHWNGTTSSNLERAKDSRQMSWRLKKLHGSLH